MRLRNLLPRLSIAELEPPTKTSTSWDFSQIDPYTEDAFKAINGHPVEFGLTHDSRVDVQNAQTRDLSRGSEPAPIRLRAGQGIARPDVQRSRGLLRPRRELVREWRIYR